MLCTGTRLWRIGVVLGLWLLKPGPSSFYSVVGLRGSGWVLPRILEPLGPAIPFTFRQPHSLVGSLLLADQRIPYPS